MATPPDPSPPRRPGLALGLGLALLLLMLPLGLLPDGRERSHLGQFLGRFHPALVHLPIALLLLVPLLELGGALGRWRHLRQAAGFVLALAALSAAAAALDGWLLAWSGGYSGALVNRHLWGGVSLAGLSLVLVGLRARFTGRALGYTFAYLPLLVVAVGLMVWTSDQGGKITHGDRFLTEYMPGRLRAWLRLPAPPAPAAPAPPAAGAAATYYQARIAPILERSCVSCHNPRKIKGGLLLDSYDHMMKGGDDGAVVVPWHPAQSDLIRRVRLPRDDDDFMPSNGKNVLSTAEIAVLERWIASGASPAEPADAAQ